MVPKLGLYAYGLVGKSQAELGKSPKQLNILGIDKKNKVYSVEGRGICVCVSKINTDEFQDEIKKLLSKLTNPPAPHQNNTGPAGGPNETEAILRSHEDVVDTLMKLTTVVPFKFGTVLKDEEAASKMLRDYEEKFKKLLSKFTGREEWGLKVYVDNQRFKKHLAKVEPRLNPSINSGLTLSEAERVKSIEVKNLPAGRQGEKLSRGVAYLLGRKMEEELKNNESARLAKASEVIFQEAGKDAYEAKLNKTLPQKLTGKEREMILNTAYLIEREKVARFCQQVKKLIEKYEPMGLEIEVSGPWPPYSFT